MEGNIYITGQIGTFNEVKGVELIDVIGQVKQQPAATSFNVHINSEGGIVEVGFAIYDYLTALKLPIKTIGSGIVASIATVIFMSGSERTVLENTPFMIHTPWGGYTGNADDMERYVEELRAAENRMVNFYKKALNLEAEAITPLLKDETWLTMEQLQTLGFTTAQPFKAVAKAHLNLNTDMNGSFSEKDRNWMEALFTKILGKSKEPIVAKVVQDANGTSIDFTGLADDATPEAGQEATIDGEPAEGEYTMPDGSKYIFEAGKLKEIVEPEAERETLEQAQARAQEAEAERDTARQELAQLQTEVAAMRKDVTALRAKIFSSHQPEGKKATPPKASGGSDKTDEKLAGMLDYLKKK